MTGPRLGQHTWRADGADGAEKDGVGGAWHKGLGGWTVEGLGVE